MASPNEAFDISFGHSEIPDSKVVSGHETFRSDDPIGQSLMEYEYVVCSML